MPTPSPSRSRPAALRAIAAAALLAFGALAGGSDARPGEDGSGAAPAGPDPERVDGRGGGGSTPRAAARGTQAAAGAALAAAEPGYPQVEWRDSTALGLPASGRLERGVRLPREGRHFFTWDPVERTSSNRPWRRFGADHVVRTTLRVLAGHRREHRRAPRVGVGDLSRPRGGDFGVAYGPIGHASHQNGLDVDVYYPLKDGRERAPLSVDEIDLGLSQELVDRFVAAGAEKVLVGPGTGLTGPDGVVQVVANHDNHLHARFRPEG